MTLRARLLTGMAVIAVVLVAAAVFITRTTEQYLVDQVGPGGRRHDERDDGERNDDDGHPGQHAGPQGQLQHRG